MSYLDQKHFSHRDKWFVKYKHKECPGWIPEWGSLMTHCPPADKINSLPEHFYYIADEDKGYRILSKDIIKNQVMYNGRPHIFKVFFTDYPKEQWTEHEVKDVARYQGRRNAKRNQSTPVCG